MKSGRIGVGVLSLAAVVFLGACSEQRADLCDSPVSVAGYVLGFSQGLTNLDEDQFLGLRLDTLEVRDTVVALAEDANVDTSTVATELRVLFDEFSTEMDSYEWNIFDALSWATVREVITEIGSESTLKKANTIEASLIERCGLPESVSISDSTVDTLPFPEIPSPTATDPPTATIDENNEHRVTGEMVGNIFGLTLTDDQVVCLGRELSTIVDATGESADIARYQRQYQAAFDECDIDFTVPVE